MTSVALDWCARSVAGISMETLDFGGGSPILVLHEGTGLVDDAAFLYGLGQAHRVIAPVHPGFGRAERPPDFDSVDDLAHLYLELVHQLGLEAVTLIGFDIGGWIGAEMATRCDHWLAKLVLVDAVGIRPGTRTDRPIADVFGLPPADVLRRTFVHPERHVRPMAELSDAELLATAQNRESLVRYTWQPYMHNPKLLARLSGIRASTLVVWGEQDGIVDVDYGRQFADAIPGAQFAVIPDAAHLPHLEQPALFVEKVLAFVDGSDLDGANS